MTISLSRHKKTEIALFPKKGENIKKKAEFNQLTIELHASEN